MKKKFTAEIKNTFETLIVLISYVDEEQLNIRPVLKKGDRDKTIWTIGQVGDHLYKSYSVLEVLKGKIATANRPIESNVKSIRDLFLNFDIQMDSPESIIPSGGPFLKDFLISGLKERSDAILHFAQTHDLSPECLDFELPNFGTLTRLEWLHFISVHTQRHNRQIQKIIDSF